MTNAEALTLVLGLTFFAQCQQCTHLEHVARNADRAADALERIAAEMERRGKLETAP